MHDVVAAQPVGAGEENDTMDPCEQAARATERAAGGIAEGAGHPREAAAAASDEAVRAGIDLMQRNAETVQHALQCGARLAARLSESSADRFGRTVGVAGEGADEATRRSSRNFEAISQSGAVLTEITERLCDEWVEAVLARMDRGFDRMDAFLQCRTPQEFTALQSEIIRDNIETLLGYVRKAGEHSVRLAGDIRQRPCDVAGGRRAA